MGPGLRVQPKASQKKVQSRSMVPWKWWTHPETLLLIEIWGNTLSEHCEEYKGKRILPTSAYEKIADRLSESGIKRSVGQIREKIKTLKKTYWGAVAKAQDSSEGKVMSGKRASVIELMRRVLQANGNMVKGKYMRKTELVKVAAATAKEKPKAAKRAKVVENQVHKMESEDEDEDDSVNPRVGADTIHGIRIEPSHVHGSSMHWSDLHHQQQQQEPQEEEHDSNSVCDANGEEYNYPPLCQLVEGLVNKFLCGQRESEERFLLLEEKRLEMERKRWEVVQRKDEDLLSKVFATYDKWRKEDQEQEVSMWALLAANTKSGSSQLSAFNNPHSIPLKWHLTGTLQPETTPAPSTSRRNN